MNKAITILALFLVMAGLCFGQKEKEADTTKNYVYGMFFTLPIEFPVINNSELNDGLSQFGFPAAKYHTANIGLGLQFYLDRGIVSFSWNKSTKTTENDFYKTEVEYSAFSLSIGYNVMPQSMWYSIYPYIGLKGCNLNYLYKDKFVAEPSFNDYFGTTLDYKEISNSRMHLDFGIGFAHHWFYLINFRVGYLLPLEKTEWKINDSKENLLKFPNITYRYYFNISIGFGAIADNKSLFAHFNRLNREIERQNHNNTIETE